CMEALEFPWTF
nr:immunoglobulin light chain junction region [Macaca mulatta]MOX97881.1 immunoglobulin light chain junction region [Macaca mulatta]MOX99352.1 immunoglobulin light chain junction region [Macaca mulatta]MOY00845.1 immunoglobulin light chain junction region [Macaca mulatta]MOY00966.1 immunoglobulin light chain junction region [Macaca mulatta]